MADQLDEYMRGLSISRMEDVEKAAVFQRQVDGVSTLYYFSIKPGQFIYRYDVEINRVLNELVRRQTRAGADDGQKQVFRKICKAAMEIVFARTNGFGGDEEMVYVYDNSKNLFTNKPVRLQQLYMIQTNEFPAEVAELLSNDNVQVEIQLCQTAQSKIDISDINPSIQFSPVTPPDHTLRTFLECLTSQYFINSNSHAIIGNALFDANPQKQIEDVLVLHDGLVKGVKIVEDDGGPVPALVADVRTCAFFEPITLDVAVNQMSRARSGGPDRDRNFWVKFSSLYHGVRVSPIYDPGRSFVIGSLSNRSIAEIKVDRDGTEVSLEEYYRQVKGITLTNTEWPGVRPNRESRDTTYPLQVLRVLPFQRIPVEKMTDQISRALLQANTTPPQQRYNAINDKVGMIGGGECGAFMRKFGVLLLGRRNGIEIKVRQPPAIRFGDKAVNVVNGNFDERNYRYYKCSNLLKSWTVAYVRNVNVTDIRNFIGNLIRTAANKGLTLPTPEFVPISADDLSRLIKTLAEKKVQFLMYIDQKYMKFHGVLKVDERQNNILTQHVTYELVQKAGPSSVTNVLNKMHMKVAFKFGLNYMPVMEPVALQRFDITKGNILVIGLDSSNFPKASPYELYRFRNDNIDMDSYDPSIIGIAANYGVEPWGFYGTYFYQPSKQDAINRDQLKIYTQWIIGKLQTNNRPNPEIVYIIRDGVSEGHIPNVVKSEFTAIREAFIEYNIIPKFIFSIVDKKHYKRFFAGRETEQKDNLLPSSVVDSRMVRPDMTEFYLQAHKPLKGTAKVPQYMFPINEMQATHDELQAFTNGLCHAFQIVNLAPSLPTPVRIAQELAKRGRNNYVQLKKDNQVPRQANSNYVDINALNEMLSYAEHTFSNTRFNA